MKLLIITLSFVLCYSCKEKESTIISKTPQQIAQDSVKAYLSKNLHNPASYESVEFGIIDSTYSTIFQTPEYEEIASMLRLYSDSSHNEFINVGVTEKWEYYWKQLDIYMDKERDFMLQYKSFVGDFSGWSLTHKYRATNSFNALTLDIDTFYLDTTFKVIGK